MMASGERQGARSFECGVWGNSISNLEPRTGRSCWLVAGLCLALLAAAGCISQERVKKADGYYQEGVAVYNTDQQSAYVSFQKALKENPRHRNAHYYVALIYATQQKFPEAEAEIREVIDIDPDFPEAHEFLGQLLVKQDRRPEAIRAFRRAAGSPLYSTPDLAYYHMSLAMQLEGDMEGAKQALEDALKFEAFGCEYIANILEQRERQPVVPSPLHLTRRQDLLDLDLPAVDLDLYEKGPPAQPL